MSALSPFNSGGFERATDETGRPKKKPPVPTSRPCWRCGKPKMPQFPTCDACARASANRQRRRNENDDEGDDL